MSLRLPDVKRSVVPWSVFSISSALTYLWLSGKVPLLHTPAQCPGMLLHVISFTRPSPALVLQATIAGVLGLGLAKIAGVRRPGLEAMF